MTDLEITRYAAADHAYRLASACLTATEALEGLYPHDKCWKTHDRVFNIRITARNLQLALKRFPKEVKR